MVLWRVDVANVSFRYVDAQSKTEAIRLVSGELLRALSISAQRASKEVQRAYDQGGRNQQRALLRALDGLHGPTQSPASLRRRILELQTELDRAERWLEDELGRSHPVTRERAEHIGRLVEHNRLSIERARVQKATELADRLAEKVKEAESRPKRPL